MKRFPIIAAWLPPVLLGACATGAGPAPLDPEVLARAVCVQQKIPPEMEVDLKKLNAEQILEFYAKIRECFKG